MPKSRVVVRKKIVTQLRRAHAKEGKILRKLGSVPALLTRARNQLQQEIGWLEATKLTAKKVKTKRELQKRINAKKVLFRRLQQS